MNFIFPTNIEWIQKIKDINNLKQALDKANMIEGSNITFRFALRKAKYLYAKCRYRGCNSKITYQLKEDIYIMSNIINTHNHSALGSKSRLFYKVQDQIRQLPLSTSILTAKAIICPKYDLKQSSFYYLFRKIKNKKISYLQLVNFLLQKKCQIQSEPYYYGMNQLPSLLIIVTPLMKDNFNKFGQWMGFDFTFNLIQQTNSQGKQWRIGIFMGISASKKLVPFGLVICNEETSDKLYSIFKSFSQIMNNFPRIIITDEDKSSASALRILKQERQFDGYHLLDCFHILRNVKKNLINKECWNYFNRLIHQQSKQFYEQIISQCINAMDQQKDIALLRKFVQNSDQYCFSQIPKERCGFLPNTSMNQKVHDLIKSIIPYSKPFTVVVKKLIIFLEQLGLKCHQLKIQSIKYQDIFQYPPLKQIRYMIAKPLFKELIFQFSKGVHHQIFQQSLNFYRIIDSRRQFKVIFEQNSWKCNCDYIIKVGLPCSHISKIVLAKKLNLLDYIDNRWKIKGQILNQIQKKYNYQRKTRRNTKK